MTVFICAHFADTVFVVKLYKHFKIKKLIDSMNGRFMTVFEKKHGYIGH